MGRGKPLESELAFRDLSDSFEALKEEHTSPVLVRRKFLEFLRSAKRLPWIMEKEFKRITGAKKSYEEFWETCPEAKACQQLRNANEHELTLRLTADERFRSSLGEILGSDALRGRKLTALVEGRKLDAFEEDLSPGIVFYHSDPDSGEIDLGRPIGRTRETRFMIDPTTEQVKTALAQCPTTDVHDLSQSCYSALKKLVENHLEDLASYDQEDD